MKSKKLLGTVNYDQSYTKVYTNTKVFFTGMSSSCLAKCIFDFLSGIFINLWEIKPWKTPREIIIIVLMLGCFLYLSVALKVGCVDKLCGSLSST